MPSKTKLKNAAIAAKSAALPKLPKELLDQFVTVLVTGEGCQTGSCRLELASGLRIGEVRRIQSHQISACVR
jgi:putative transposase